MNNAAIFTYERHERDRGISMIVYFRVAVALLVLCCASSPATGDEKTKFYVGASSKTLGYSPLWVGVKKGFFDQQGLDAQLLLLRGTTMTVQAMAGASLNVGSGNPEAFIEASERGLDLVMIGGVINGLTISSWLAKNTKLTKTSAVPLSDPLR